MFSKKRQPRMSSSTTRGTQAPFWSTSTHHDSRPDAYVGVAVDNTAQPKGERGRRSPNLHPTTHPWRGDPNAFGLRSDQDGVGVGKGEVEPWGHLVTT